MQEDSYIVRKHTDLRKIVPHRKGDRARVRTLYLECFLSLKKI